jgi:hypothetical protein
MFEMVAEQLLAAAERRAVELDASQASRPANPNPPGSIWPGASTDAVLVVMRQQPQRWWTRCQLIAVTNRTNRQINWALHFLQATGKVEAVQDEARNARYLRYRVAKGAING